MPGASVREHAAAVRADMRDVYSTLAPTLRQYVTPVSAVGQFDGCNDFGGYLQYNILVQARSLQPDSGVPVQELRSALEERLRDMQAEGLVQLSIYPDAHYLRLVSTDCFEVGQLEAELAREQDVLND